MQQRGIDCVDFRTPITDLHLLRHVAPPACPKNKNGRVLVEGRGRRFEIFALCGAWLGADERVSPARSPIREAARKGETVIKRIQHAPTIRNASLRRQVNVRRLFITIFYVSSKNYKLDL
jgi:hypothetical protein